MLTHKRLREVLNYNPCTGTFRWRITRLKAKAGKVAGARRSDGYAIIGIDGISYRAARLAWFYTYGEWPEPEVDHINRDPTQDSIWNLRCVDRQGNVRNSGACGPQNLTMYQVREIQRRRAAGERGIDLAKEYGVSVYVICDIHRRNLVYTLPIETGLATFFETLRS